jgi:hypothetical protein
MWRIYSNPDPHGDPAQLTGLKIGIQTEVTRPMLYIAFAQENLLYSNSPPEGRGHII